MRYINKTGCLLCAVPHLFAELSANCALTSIILYRVKVKKWLFFLQNLISGINLGSFFYNYTLLLQNEKLWPLFSCPKFCFQILWCQLKFSKQRSGFTFLRTLILGTDLMTPALTDGLLLFTFPLQHFLSKEKLPTYIVTC